MCIRDRERPGRGRPRSGCQCAAARRCTLCAPYNSSVLGTPWSPCSSSVLYTVCTMQVELSAAHLAQLCTIQWLSTAHCVHRTLAQCCTLCASYKSSVPHIAEYHTPCQNRASRI
eukprot:2510157-Rhodomonas_salina.1